MQKVSFSFPPEMVVALDNARGAVSRNRFVIGLLGRALREYQEQELHRRTADVYGDESFAAEEERLAEQFFAASPEADL